MVQTQVYYLLVVDVAGKATFACDDVMDIYSCDDYAQTVSLPRGSKLTLCHRDNLDVHQLAAPKFNIH